MKSEIQQLNSCYHNYRQVMAINTGIFTTSIYVWFLNFWAQRVNIAESDYFN